jgi:hypothetical protein
LAVLGACNEAPENQPATQSRGAANTTVLTTRLLDTLRVILRQRNPIIEHVAFPQIQWFDYGRSYVAIAWGIRSDRNFNGSFQDELFGILVLDSTLTGVRKVLDVFPTERWYDYSVRIEALTGDSIIIAGRGDTYGDATMRKAYPWP